MKVVAIACDAKGNVDLDDLKLKAEKHSNELAALMVTYPPRCIEQIKDICAVVHAYGGQVYMDGEYECPGWAVPSRRFRGGCLSLEPAQTFCIPHGGGDLVWDRLGSCLICGVPAWAFCHLDGGEQGIGAAAAAPWVAPVS